MQLEDFMEISRRMGQGISAESQRNRSEIVPESFRNPSTSLAESI